MAPVLTNPYDFEEVLTFKRYVSKFHDNLTFSSQVTVVIVLWDAHGILFINYLEKETTINS